MKPNSLSVVILAAGKGTRMKSAKAKVLHEVFFATMVTHVVKAASPLNPSETILVIGHQKEKVENAVKNMEVTFAIQSEQLGTGHAVLMAESEISPKSDTVMILCGDTPLIKSEILQEMYSAHIATGSDVTLMTTILDNPTNYGRIVSDATGSIQEIVEQKDANKQQLLIKEINAGIYCVNKKFLFNALKEVGTDNSQGEVYLTDIVKIAVDGNLKVKTFVNKDAIDVLGVNSRVELAAAQVEMQLRRNRDIMLMGVSMYNPETIQISPDSAVGQDSTINSSVYIKGSQIGQSCKIGQDCHIIDCEIEDNVEIGPFCYLKGQQINEGTKIPPYTQKN